MAGTRAKALTGARCKLYINGQLAGVFTSVTYGVSYGMSPVYVLGRYGPAELCPTDQDVVTVTTSGFRVIGNGPHKIGNVPMLQDLLNHEDISLQIIDRQTEANDPANSNIMTVTGVRPTGYDTTTSSRGLQDLTVRFIGLAIHDESGNQADTGAVDFG
jgi:hypothetical protein